MDTESSEIRGLLDVVPIAPNWFQLLKNVVFSAQELLKYTSADHPDYPHVVAAQKAMKEVAMLINEQKRRIENMGKIGCWQKTIDGWKVITYGELHVCASTVHL